MKRINSKFNRVVGVLLILMMSVSLCACGKEEEKFKGLAMETRDFINCNLGASVDTVKALEKNKLTAEIDANDISKVQNVPAATLQYAIKNHMDMLAYGDAKLNGMDCEIAYAFFNNQLAMGIIGFKNLKDPQKTWDEMKEYYDKLLGEASSDNGESRVYMQTNTKWLVISFDGKEYVGISVLDLNLMR